jgi:hypothetical protein
MNVAVSVVSEIDCGFSEDSFKVLMFINLYLLILRVLGVVSISKVVVGFWMNNFYI